MKICLFLLFLTLTGVTLRAEHPHVLVTPADHDAIEQKMESTPWAKSAYEKMKMEVDHYVNLVEVDPGWLSSRLAMNWQTHYRTPLLSRDECVGGQGKAPIPTPRFAGARDWTSNYFAPRTLEEWKPFNDQNGKIFLINNTTGLGEWIEPKETGRAIESMNEHIMQIAANAGFLYWITGEEQYARLAAGVLWTYMDGFSHVTAPKINPADATAARLAGLTTFDVAHEDIVAPLSETYDFIHDYLQAQGQDVVVIQKGLKRMIERVVEGGSDEGNSNLNQARIIAYGALALEDNKSYLDGKGRSYYLDVILNARLANQKGLNHVIADSIDPTTALWPEAPSYGFHTTRDLLLIATLMAIDPAGRTLMHTPIIPRMVPAQTMLLYPNGWSAGLGDSYQTRLDVEAAELEIAAARQSGDKVTEDQVTALLQHEIADGYYDRNQQTGLIALTKYVDALHEVASETRSEHRCDWMAPINILMQRNPSENSDYQLAAALYGTEGDHMQANGLALELYGRGTILAPDPGRTANYSPLDYLEYYSQPPAHNTVIVDGRSDYPAQGPGHLAMKLELVEPPLGEGGRSPNINFAQASFTYTTPAAQQRRTLFLIRTGPRSGFYVDIFRSKEANEESSFHDYLYHGLAQSMKVFDDYHKTLPLKSSAVLTSANANLKGYDYFKNEQSIDLTSGVRAIFSLDPGNGQKKRGMSMWMLGGEGRTLFSVEAPPCRAVRDSLPSLMATPMPTLLVRQVGEAWEHPFITVFEPYFDDDGTNIEVVRPAKIDGDAEGLVACIVEGRAIEEGAPRFRAIVMEDVHPERARKVEGFDFQGHAGVILLRGNQIQKVYR